LNSAENVYVVVTVIYCWLGRERGRRGRCLYKLIYDGGGGLGSCFVNGFLSLGDFTIVWDFREGWEGEGGGRGCVQKF
jgi:hypothetical protein